MVVPPNAGAPPASLDRALKEWAVAIRALREGRQILLLRKGGIHEAGGEFAVEARDVLLFPTFLHEDEQTETLQPCYTAWLRDEQKKREKGENVRIEAWAQVTDILPITNFGALLGLGSQHIYSEKFVRYRIGNEPHKTLYALFLRAYNLSSPVTVPMEMDYYGCKSWITLSQPIATGEAAPAMSDTAYAERLRITKNLLTK